MLRLVCQVHLVWGLTASAPIPGKPALALGTMSQCSAQILICISLTMYDPQEAAYLRL